MKKYKICVYAISKNEEKYVTSYLMSSNTINYEMNEIEEISSVLSETANYYFVYISYTNDADVYNLEKSLKPIIDKYDLNNNFYYINVTNIKENKAKYKKEIADRLNIDEKEMNNIPIIMYFKDGVLTQSAKTAKDLENLVKNQGINSL